MIITMIILSRVSRKNPKARKRMANRLMRKVSRRIGPRTKYTELELMLSLIGRGQQTRKHLRARAKLLDRISANVTRRMLKEYPHLPKDYVFAK